MMRRSAGFHADEARRQLLKEWQNVPALELTANDYMTCRVNSVDSKNRSCNIETNCRDRLHVWLLRIVGASAAPTSMALPCRWRSRPQHQKRTNALQQNVSLFDHLIGARPLPYATGIYFSGGCNGDRWSLRFGALFHRALLSAQTQRTVDQTHVTIGLRKITQHPARQRTELFREQSHIIAAREQPREQLARICVAALQYIIVDEPKAARQESSFACGQAVAGMFGFVTQNEFTVDQKSILDGTKRSAHPRVLGRKKADYRDQ